MGLRQRPVWRLPLELARQTEQQHLNMHATWEKRTREEISLVTQFLDTDYREFTSRIENTALPLLPRWTP